MKHQLKQIRLNRISNYKHIEFHHAVLRCISEYPLEAIQMDAVLLKQYESAMAEEQSHLSVQRAHVLTPLMKQKQEERDRQYRFISLQLRLLKMHSDEKMQQLYAQLVPLVIRKFPLQLFRRGRLEQTSLIRSFILLLRHDFAAITEQLNLEPHLALLEKQNNAYEEMYNARNADYANLPARHLAKARAVCDEFYAMIMSQTEALAMRVSADDNAPQNDVYKKNAHLLTQINELVTVLKQKKTA